MTTPLDHPLIGFNAILHKPNGDIAISGTIKYVSPQGNNFYELYTENGIMKVQITPSEIKQLTWKETIDVKFYPGGGHDWTAHFYKVRK